MLLLFSSDSLHPAIVHFPIALLAIAPLFCLGVLVLRDKGWWLSIATLVLLAIGTAGTHLASATGDAGEDKAEAVPGADIVVEEHERLAETATVFFTIVSLSYAAWVFGPRLLRKQPGGLWHVAGNAAFLIVMVVGVVLVLKTAHLGGQLVHRYGIHASTAAQQQDSLARTQSAEGRPHDDD